MRPQVKWVWYPQPSFQRTWGNIWGRLATGNCENITSAIQSICCRVTQDSFRKEGSLEKGECNFSLLCESHPPGIKAGRDLLICGMLWRLWSPFNTRLVWKGAAGHVLWLVGCAITFVCRWTGNRAKEEKNKGGSWALNPQVKVRSGRICSDFGSFSFNARRKGWWLACEIQGGCFPRLCLKVFRKNCLNIPEASCTGGFRSGSRAVTF